MHQTPSNKNNQSPSFIDHYKLIQLSLGILSVFTIYSIFGIVYEKIIMSSYSYQSAQINQQNHNKQFFQSSLGFVFLQRFICWIVIEIITFIFKNKNLSKSSSRQNQNKPLINLSKNNIIAGFLIFLSSIMFVKGIYYTSFRLSFAIRTGAFLASSFFGYFFSYLSNKSNVPKVKDICIGFILTGSTVLYWVYDPQICFYVPVMPGIISVVIVSFSTVFQGIVSLFQAKIKQTQNPSIIQMQLNLNRITFFFSFVFVLITGEIFYTISFITNHFMFLRDILILGTLSCLGQLFIYRIINKFSLNIAPYVVSSRKVLSIQIGYLFTVQKYCFQQVFFIIISWIAIVCEFIFAIKKSQKSYQTVQNPYRLQNQMFQEEVQQQQ